MKIKLQAEIDISQSSDGSSVVSLFLVAETPEAQEALWKMGWGKLPGVDGLQYCSVNTVCPHTISGNLLVMTVNYNPWTKQKVPSVPSS